MSILSRIHRNLGESIQLKVPKSARHKAFCCRTWYYKLPQAIVSIGKLVVVANLSGAEPPFLLHLGSAYEVKLTRLKFQ